MVPARLVRCCFAAFLNPCYNTSTFKGVSNTSSLSISFNSHSGASARVLSKEECPFNHWY